MCFYPVQAMLEILNHFLSELLTSNDNNFQIYKPSSGSPLSVWIVDKEMKKSLSVFVLYGCIATRSQRESVTNTSCRRLNEITGEKENLNLD